MEIYIKTFLFAALTLTVSFKNSFAQDKDLVVRIAKIQIDSTQLQNYTAAVKEQIEVAVRVESGVKTLYAVAAQDNPTRITVFEIYASEKAYKTHLETSHFKKYKTGTKEMVKSLKLLETVPIVLATKPHATREKEYIRVVDLDIDSTRLKFFNAALKEDIDEAVRSEPGVYTLYAVSEKNSPTHITIFEIYASEEAHKSHQQTEHFIKYKRATEGMVKSTVRTEAVPVALEAKLN